MFNLVSFAGIKKMSLLVNAIIQSSFCISDQVVKECSSSSKRLKFLLFYVDIEQPGYLSKCSKKN